MTYSDKIKDPQKQLATRHLHTAIDCLSRDLTADQIENFSRLLMFKSNKHSQIMQMIKELKP